jgi:Tfp pilus assembly protein PilV
MRTFSARLRVLGRTFVGLPGRALGLATLSRGVPSRRLPLTSEAGDTLMEVLISTLLVGLIVVGTLTGFNAVNRTTTDQRQHNEAALLAAQSQEQLRTAPASALNLLQATPNEYKPPTIGGTTYTVVQKTELQPASGSGAICSVTETKRQSGNSFRITSTVTWPTLGGSKKINSVVASSLVTPPTGSALEIDADNAPEPTSGVSGITAIVTYTPVGGGGAVTLEQTTGLEGCVVFAGIPATTATVEIRELAGYVTRSGAPKFPTKEVKIAPNYTTHYAVTYNHGGAIKGEFAYENKTTPRIHKNNEGTGNVSEAITGDTFVSFNAKMEAKPDYEVASTLYTAPAAGVYHPLSATSSSTYETFATSPSILFPFTESEKSPWSVYAGDCAENNPEKVTSGAVKPSTVYVTPGGGISSVMVPTSYVTLNLYKESGSEKVVNEHSSEKSKYLETTTSRPVTITNSKCAGVAAPNNESAPSTKHLQATTTGTINGGHLTDPFQPFGTEFELCVVGPERTYKVKYENKALTGGNVSIYLHQRPMAEVVKERGEMEAAYKTKETEYKTEETEYKTKETAYKAKETEYKTAKSKYESTGKASYKTEYEKDKTEYEKLKGEYEKLKGEYVTDKTESVTDKGLYEEAKTEEKEGTSVTVEKGTVCS